MRIFISANVRRARAIAAAIAISLCCAAGTTAAQQIVDRVVASVDGDPITAHDIEAFSIAMGHPVRADNIADNPDAKLMLKELIAAKLFQSEAQQYASKIDDTQVDNYIDQLRHDRHMTPDQMKAAIAQSGMSMQDFRKHARDELEKAMMIQQQVRDRVNLSDSDIQTYYDQHKSDYTISKERYRLSQILIGVPANANPQQVEKLKAKADQIRSAAVKGADFGNLARRYSDDESRNNGGELGWFEPQDIMDQILAAVKPVKVGDVSQIVRTSHGFHILKVEAHEVPGVRPLAEVKDDIREKMVDQKAKAETQEWVETELVKKHDVETLY
ncbi:MAG: peptidylprolyl isomerase [Candidatus Binataceae bacterium]